jgi:RNA polymerase sigma-70 factor (ECF subfamily)
MDLGVDQAHTERVGRGTLADPEWLARFQAGDRSALEAAYRAAFPAVLAAAASILPRVDAETVVHEVFCRLLAEPDLRARFQGGSLGAWLGAIARNLAIDHLRRAAREKRMAGTMATLAVPDSALPAGGSTEDELAAGAAKRLVERFRAECLPAKWQAVFEARFLRQLGQHEAARALGVHRTTLAYQEHRIRALLRRFLLRESKP